MTSEKRSVTLRQSSDRGARIDAHHYRPAKQEIKPAELDKVHTRRLDSDGA
ncbi:MAG TPA: hypothetical protein VK598_02090 [Nitrospiraceae bacterium]|nr:hypothetical protein [Nitrospiraceae bacterium]